MKNLSSDSRKQLRETPGVDQTFRSVLPGGAQENVIGLVAPQHIIDQIG